MTISPEQKRSIRTNVHERLESGLPLTSAEMDIEREQNHVYEYMCHFEEAKLWLSAVINKNVQNFESELPKGIILAEVGKILEPEIVKKIFLDETLQYRHTDNINFFLQAVLKQGLPKIFLFEVFDLYERRNIPRVIYCIHALAHFLNKKNIFPKISDLIGKIYFSDEQIQEKNEEINTAGLKLPHFKSIAQKLRDELIISSHLIYFFKYFIYKQTITEHQQLKNNTFNILLHHELLLEKKEKIRNFLVQKIKEFLKLHKITILQSKLKSLLYIKAFNEIFYRKKTLTLFSLRFYIFLLFNTSKTHHSYESEMHKIQTKINKILNENFMHEKYIDELEMRISLLVNNKVTVSNMVMNKPIPQDITLISQDTPHYKNLTTIFYILQTNPKYLIKILYNIQDKDTFIINTIVPLFYFGHGIREECLVNKLIDHILDTYNKEGYSCNGEGYSGDRDNYSGDRVNYNYNKDNGYSNYKDNKDNSNNSNYKDNYNNNYNNSNYNTNIYNPYPYTNNNNPNNNPYNNNIYANTPVSLCPSAIICCKILTHFYRVSKESKNHALSISSIISNLSVLEIECDPVNIYKELYNSQPLREIALQDIKVKNIYISRLKTLRGVINSLLNILQRNITNTPFILRYFLKQLFIRKYSFFGIKNMFYEEFILPFIIASDCFDNKYVSKEVRDKCVIISQLMSIIVGMECGLECDNDCINDLSDNRDNSFSDNNDNCISSKDSSKDNNYISTKDNKERDNNTKDNKEQINNKEIKNKEIKNTNNTNTNEHNDPFLCDSYGIFVPLIKFIREASIKFNEIIISLGNAEDLNEHYRFGGLSSSVRVQRACVSFTATEVNDILSTYKIYVKGVGGSSSRDGDGDYIVNGDNSNRDISNYSSNRDISNRDYISNNHISNKDYISNPNNNPINNHTNNPININHINNTPNINPTPYIDPFYSLICDTPLLKVNNNYPIKFYLNDPSLKKVEEKENLNNLISIIKYKMSVLLYFSFGKNVLDVVLRESKEEENKEYLEKYKYLERSYFNESVSVDSVSRDSKDSVFDSNKFDNVFDSSNIRDNPYNTNTNTPYTNTNTNTNTNTPSNTNTNTPSDTADYCTCEQQGVIDSTFNLSKKLPENLEELKSEILDSLNFLESVGILKKSNLYVDMLFMISNDVLVLRSMNEERNSEMLVNKMTLNNLNMKNEYLKEKVRVHEEYLISFAEKMVGIKKKSFFKFEDSRISKLNKQSVYGTYVFSANKMKRKNVLLEIYNYNVNQYNGIFFLILCDKPNFFCVEMYVMDVLVGDGVSVRLDELLRSRFKGVSDMDYCGVCRFSVKGVLELINECYIK
ncbi:Ras GTPase-activating-like protein [Hamiltosporidium tvaerminnensis]|uniref:Ras GTPase-activating-like protein n=1 Tax=Hamiltosporidium tvaerminnensis TaxID=1176355 RepID=A0A4Q9KWJ7_9MICR|nr:Ras GTPase-activating-like protein [Hamiltosporidium tvaerminnensis]